MKAWYRVLSLLGLLSLPALLPAQSTAQPDIAAWHATESELQSTAIVERKIMVPMRDGKRMVTGPRRKHLGYVRSTGAKSQTSRGCGR